jgi:hypothetical protein
MGAFFAACVAFIVLGAGGYFGLNAMQTPTGAALTSGAARIDPSWTSRTEGNEACEPRASWQWFFVDFGTPDGEAKACAVSQ